MLDCAFEMEALHVPDCGLVSTIGQSTSVFLQGKNTVSTYVSLRLTVTS